MIKSSIPSLNDQSLFIEISFEAIANFGSPSPIIERSPSFMQFYTTLTIVFNLAQLIHCLWDAIEG